MADAEDVRRLAGRYRRWRRFRALGSTSGSAAKVSCGPIRATARQAAGHPNDIAVLFVGDEDEKQALLLGEPDLFFTAPGYREAPLVMLRLARVGVERLSDS